MSSFTRPADTNPYPKTMATQRELAKIIYDAVYLPGQVDDGDGVMPSFDEAEARTWGAFDRVMNAAALVLKIVG